MARCLCAGFLTTLLVATAARAQERAEAAADWSANDLSIEELMEVEVPTVYGASKYLQAVTEAPASVTVITAEEIKLYGYRKLAAILQSVRGFSMSYDRNYDYLGFRAFSRPGDYNTRMLLLIDGVRINDSVYDDAGIGNDFPLDVDLIERVEVIRGPSHSLYGSNAFFGVINVITKTGRACNGAELSGEAGSFSTYKGRASYGRKYGNGLEALVSGSFLDSRGQDLFFREFATPEQNDGWARGGDGERYGSGFLKLRYKDFTLEGGYLKRRKNVPTASFGTVFNTSQNRTFDTRAFADLKYEHQFPDRLGVLARVSYNSYHYDGDYLYALDPGTVLNKDYSRADTVSSELQLTKELRTQTLVAGVEVRGNYRQNQGNYDPGTVYLDDRRSSVSWGIYGQDELTLRDDLVLHAGVRFDHFESFGDTWNPRLALVYTPLDDTTIKLIYGKAFRAPNAYELYYTSFPDFRSNPKLREEKDTTYEIVVEQALGEQLQGSLSGFYNRMSNVISHTRMDDGSQIFQNIDAYITKGIELELQGTWQNGVQGRASYALQKASRSGSDTRVTDSPRQLAKLNLILPMLPDRIFLGLEGQFTDRRETVSGVEAPAFFVSNLTLFSKQLVKGLEISASVYNLFDRRYGDPASGDHLQDLIPQDGRTFRIKASYAF